MVERNRLAAPRVHLRIDLIAHAQVAGLEHAYMRERCAHLACIVHLEARTGPNECAGVADLAAALRIERRSIQDDLSLLPGPQGVDQGSVENQRRDLADPRKMIVSREQRFPRQLHRVTQIGAEFARGARASALSLHRRIEPRLVDREPALARHIGRQIERKAVGVVEPEHGLARNHG